MFLKELKRRVSKFFPLYFVALMIFRPKIFLQDFVYAIRDYYLFFKSLGYLPAPFVSETQSILESEKGSLLIVFGYKQGLIWVHIWCFLGLLYKAGGKPVFCLTSKASKVQNLYIRRCNFSFIFLEDLHFETEELSNCVLELVSALSSFSDFKKFEIDSIPFGKMALSTYSRLNASGVMDIGDVVAKNEVLLILVSLLKNRISADKLYKKYDVSMVFFTELFMEFYGPFYYSALAKNLNIIRFAGTVRDDGIVVQHMTTDSDRTHFSSLSNETMDCLKSSTLSHEMEKELDQNFIDRYSDRWDLSSRNQINAKIVEPDLIRQSFNIAESEKVAIIYSHILYDNLFFNGEYLFDNYAVWLVESIKAACLNPNVQWFIKIHPSNLWRGELESYHKGKYEEVRLIDEHVGALPDHIRLIFPDTPFSPYSWLQVADIGVTVTGTSGIELGALGKTVITGGTGRYENVGFTINSNTSEEYLHRLSLAHQLRCPSYEQTVLAKKFAHMTFCMKPYSLDFVTPKPRTGKSRIFGVDDLAFTCSWDSDDALPTSLSKFLKWSLDISSIDFLTR